MEFFLDEMKIRPLEVAQFPASLGYSLKKRIRPRWLVMKILIEKNLKSISRALSYFFIKEQVFLELYIQPYVSSLPHLKDVYDQTKEGIKCLQDNTRRSSCKWWCGYWTVHPTLC